MSNVITLSIVPKTSPPPTGGQTSPLLEEAQLVNLCGVLATQMFRLYRASSELEKLVLRSELAEDERKRASKALASARFEIAQFVAHSGEISAQAAKRVSLLLHV
ncbi:hypothetical protein RA307_13545 [Xanthobacteraceae bacterium Astr-EGSB]|uniref:hypothetical protein n=1 Tax=Astrobacterium formosum TaxID=3069710 RepID=UPI0027B0002C|nr:hypothetical protein [Xanthobacteraceae bacterium Astr-EGSB]